jgi:hypothetical protein
VQSWRWSGTRELPKGKKERKGNVRVRLEERKTLKYRSTGHIYEVKRITNPFVILDPVDGLMQRMTKKQRKRGRSIRPVGIKSSHED